MSIPILATKLHIPPPRSDRVLRPRLIDQLNAGLPGKLTVISAPAGFGKTTLLSAWIARCARPAVWLSLDERDSDPHRFLTYFVAALQTHDPAIGQMVLDALQNSQSAAIEALLTPLLNDLAAAPENFLLILDDYHRVDSSTVDNALTFLLDHLPPQMHLVIATREDPQLPLARLRVRGQLTELRAADLRFTPDEAADFLNRVMSLNLSAADVDALEKRTEGWIAGLQLAALSIQGRGDHAADFIQAFTGSHRFVLDYLIEEVLRQQPAEVRRFLLHTSILDQLSGPLCDAVTGNQTGQKMLEMLDRGNLFVLPLDHARHWYRYHHLFAGALGAHLHSEQPDQVAVLHRRAAGWYAANDLPREAIQHALAAEDFDHAADLLEQIWPAMDEGYQSAGWLAWARALPDAVLRARPVLCHGLGRSLLYAGELEAADTWLTATERWLKTSPAQRETMRDAGTTQFERLPAAINCARAYRAMAQGDIAATEHYAQQALDQLVPGDHLGRVQAIAFSGLARWAAGDLATADRVLSDFIAEMQMIGRIVDVIELAFVIADMRSTRGQLRAAHQVYDHAFRMLAEQGTPLLMGVEDLHRGLADLYREMGRFDRAEDQLVAAEEAAEQLVIRPDWEHRLAVSWARLKLARGDLDAALVMLDEAQRHLIRSPLPPVRPTAALRARVWLRQGKLDAAAGWAAQQDLVDDGDIPYVREYEYITLARLYIARYQTRPSADTLHAATHLLDRLLQSAEASGRMGSAIEILILQALVHAAQGDTAAALVPLERALTLAAPEGYVEVFVAEGAPLRSLLGDAAQHGIASDYIRQLQAAFSGAIEPVPTAQLPLDPLSERELEVLRLLGTELNGPEIAREMVVSLNTMRTHTKNIYSKLGVNSRRAAIRRATELGLL